jgi:hypothetical protein
MAKETTLKGRIAALQRLLARLSSNSEELPHLEMTRIRLEEQVARLFEAADRQALHTAAKQEATQELKTFLAEGERLATVLQLAVKQHYGIRAEKLVDFGLKPFRGRPRNGAPGTEPPPFPPPAPEPTPPFNGGATNP